MHAQHAHAQISKPGNTLPTSYQPYFRTTKKPQQPSQPARLDRSVVAHTYLRATSTCGTVCATQLLTRPTAGACTAWKDTSTDKSKSQGIPKAKMLPR